MLVISTGQFLAAGNAPEFIASIQLTQAQIAQIKTIEAQYSDQINQFQPELAKAERALTELIVSTASADQVRQQERDLEAFKNQAAQVYFEKFLALRDVLSAPQLQKICHLTDGINR
jgi:Spy/CpxP family protein refolding chaperone